MKDQEPYLRHILDAIARIETYTAGGDEAFFSDPMQQDAVVRNFEIIGEAVKHLSPAMKATVPDVSWRKIAGMRDVLIHDYISVRLETVWEAVEGRLSELKRAVERLLEESKGVD